MLSEVLQGSNNGPNLFMLFINDVVSRPKKSKSLLQADLLIYCCAVNCAEILFQNKEW